jgi:rhamnosyltransferase
MIDTPEVSFVIRARNEAARIGECLVGLQSQETGRRAEIIVIDSGSTDGTVEICRAHGVPVEAIPPETFNYGRALNLGARLARGHYFVSFTAHAAPADNSWLERLLAPLDASARIAAVFGRELPWPDASPLERARLAIRFPPDERRYTVEGLQGCVRETLLRSLLFSNVASAIPRELLLESPFPEMAYAEDKAWAQTMLKRGYDIVYEPAARVYHSHNDTLLAFYRRQFKIGQSKREVAGVPLAAASVARVAAGELKQQVRFLHANVPAVQQPYWMAQAALRAALRFVAQLNGSRCGATLRTMSG